MSNTSGGDVQDVFNLATNGQESDCVFYLHIFECNKSGYV